jgi:thiamine-monophosphate kinase
VAVSLPGVGISIADAGEFGLITAITSRMPGTPSIPLGPGDDAAVVSAPDGRVVATTDLLVEDRHFRRAWSGPYDVGRRAAAQNLADIAAMGAAPTALLVGFAAPPETPMSWAEGLADGLAAECARVGAGVAGGDIVGGGELMVAVTALGDLGGRPPVTRSGARPGDVAAVCGHLGFAAAGFALLEAGHDAPAVAVDRYRCPEPPYDQGPRAADHGATAMIDTSDGLLADLGHIARASGVAIDLDPAALAPEPDLAEAAAVLGADPLEWVLRGGEDHALAATFPAGAAVPDGWRVIGRVGSGRTGVTLDGAPVDGSGGWDHFA